MKGGVAQLANATNELYMHSTTARKKITKNSAQLNIKI